MSDKTSINLLQPELLPEKALWTLQRVAALWSVVLITMLVWMAIVHYSLASNQKINVQLSSENQTLQNQMADMEKQLAAHKPATKLVNEFEALQFVIDNKQQLLQQLTDTSSTQVVGFAAAMTELSALHHKDLNLQTIQINPNYIAFTGIARTAEVVPAWLARFEHSRLLSGKRFVNFSLKENDSKLTEFSVSSRVGEE